MTCIHRFIGRFALAWVVLVAFRPDVYAQSGSPPPFPVPNLATASIEDLMSMDVTSVSKKDQTLSRTGAAVFVIGREDIRRSGASNIPDLLRMAPGVEVARVNANQWAISIRGFNAIYSNKVLVLIDGRSVYSYLFSGVFWDQIDVPLEDIERIEVIRGPGGTVWGANAVNGVINIITQSAADTKGGLAVASAGTSQAASGLLQYGADAGSRGAYRVFGKYFNDNNSPLPGGQTASDGANGAHGGFRGDWGLTAHDTLSVQGDLLRVASGETSTYFNIYPPVAMTVNRVLEDRSGDVLARWEHTLNNGSETVLQVSESALSRNEYADRITDDALDVEFEHHLRFGNRHDFVWGLDYRTTTNGVLPIEPWGIHFSPQKRTISLFAGFAQDEIQISPRLFLTVGSKIEHSGYMGLEFEPSAQLVWMKTPAQSFWISAARAIREPDHYEHDLVPFPDGYASVPEVGPIALVIGNNPALKAESLKDYEAGYRTQINSRVSLDLTTFVGDYRNLLTYEPQPPAFSAAGLEIPVALENRGRAIDYGVEAFGNWQATSRWKISPGFSLLRMSVKGDPSSQDASLFQIPGDSPRQQFEIRSQFNPGRNLEWDSSLKYVAALPSLNIPAYARFDMRLGWKMGEHGDFSVSAQNLGSAGHFEFFDVSHLYTASEIARSVFGKLTLRF